MMTWLAVLAAWPLAAKTHVMSRRADPGAVPAWEEVFNEGPFDLPAGATRASTAGEAMRLGWAALHQLDDREAERAFRLAITRDEEAALGYLGLALANDALPGRALAFARRAAAKSGVVAEPERRLITAFAAVCGVPGPARRAAEMAWVRDLREVWVAEPAGPARDDWAALLVRGLARAGLLTEARLRLRDLRAAAPEHPAGAYALWLASHPEDAAAALASAPATPGARRAAGAMLERLGRPAEAAAWFAAAGALASARHPADMEDWRFFEEMRVAEVAALAAAGRADLPDEAPLAARVEAWLRMEAWDRLAAVPDLPERAPLADRAALAHARALAAFVQGRLPAAHVRLAELQQLLARARSGAGGAAPEELPVLEGLEAELQLYNLLARGEAGEARARFASLSTLSSLRAARLALALDLPREAMMHARAAAQMRPQARPEQDLLATVARATSQRLPRSEDGTDPPAWPRLPPPPPPTAPAAAAAAPGTLPAWSLRDAQGTARSLADIQDGRPVVLLFFLGRECRHCMNQLRTFDPMAARFEKAGARLVAISVDRPEGVARTFASLEMEPAVRPFAFPILADPEREAFGSWGVMDEFYGDAIHGVFVLDAGGRLRWRHLGVEPYMMAADVLAAVEELGAAGGR